jgi:hypothetical protein
MAIKKTIAGNIFLTVFILLVFTLLVKIQNLCLGNKPNNAKAVKV